MKRFGWAGEAVAILVVLGTAMGSVWPMVINPSRVAKIGTDGVLIAWIINQGQQNISGLFRPINGREGGLFEGNIYYPYKHVLAYSEMFYLSALLTLPVKLVGQPEIISGILLIVGQVMTMGVIYIWWREMTGNKWAAMIGAVALGWSRIRWEYQVHLQMWGMQWWLVAAYCWWKWLKEKRTGWWLGAGILWGLQAWESLLPVYFMAGVSGVLAVKDKQIKQWVKMAVTAFLIASPVLLTYAQVGKEFNYVRSIRESANNGMSINELVTKFGDYGLYLLVIVGMFKGIKKGGGWLAAILVIGVVMALGPVVKWEGKTVKIAEKIPIPLPYAGVYYLVPGFTGMRTPSRWMWLAALGGSGLIAWSLKDPKISKSGIAAALAVAIIGGSGLAGELELPRAEQIPKVYQWMAKQSGQVVAELPVGDEHQEKWRMWYSLFDKKTRVNGFSGFTPPEWEKLGIRLNTECLTKELEKKLVERGVDYVIIHDGESGWKADNCQKWLKENKEKIIRREGQTVIVEV